MSFSIPLNFEQTHMHDAALSHQELIHWASSKENKLESSFPPLLVGGCGAWGDVVLNGSPALRALA